MSGRVGYGVSGIEDDDAGAAASEQLVQGDGQVADPFPEDDPLPGAYELRLHSENVTIWYTVTPHEGQEVISIQHVMLDT